MLTHGELFAGISGFGLGFSEAGIETVWHVEIDKKCQDVLRRHYPSCLILSDIKDCGVHNLPPVDIISFGSPCQDLSVAGKRGGLGGQKSGLFYEAIRIVDELKPTFAVWENVPGAFSSNSGRDFAAVLLAFQDIGARDIAWTCLDAQYFGVAQRRRRIFLTADFTGNRAAEILFESEDLSWDSAPRRETGKELAKDVAASIRSGGDSKRGWIGDAEQGLVASTLTRQMQGQSNQWPPINEADNLIPEIARTIASREGQRWEPTIETLLPVAYTIQTNDGGEYKRKDRPQGGMYVKETEQALTLGSSDQTVVAFDRQSGGDVRLNISDKHTSALQSSQVPAVMNYGVRRLTPTECERLQGFSDGHTAWGIDSDGKRIEMSDSARYRMLRNAVCVPVAKWIGQQIIKADSLA